MAEAPTVIEEIASELAATDGSTDRHAARLPIPSDRERGTGVQAPEFVAAVKVEVEDAPGTWERAGVAARQFIKEADPREALKDTKYGLRPALVFVVVGLFIALEGDVFALFAPEIKQDFNFDLTQTALLGLLTGVLIAPLGPLMGYLADRKSRVWMLRIGSFIANLGTLAQALVYTPVGLVLSGFVRGIGGSIEGPTGGTLMADYYEPRVRGRVFAFRGIGLSGGGIVALLIVGTLSLVLPWRPVLLIMGTLATIATFGYFRLREPIRGEMDRLAMGATAAAASTPQKALKFAEGWRTVLAVKTIRQQWLALPFILGASGGVLFVQQFYLAGFLQVTTTGRAIILAANGVVGIIAAFFSGPISDRLLARKPGRVMPFISLTTLLTVPAWLAMATVPNIFVITALGLVPAFVTGVVAPAQGAVFSLVTPARVRAFSGQIVGVFTAFAAPFTAIIVGVGQKYSLREAIYVAIPIVIVGAAIQFFATFTVEQDIRAAMAATMADEEARRARERGRNKMLICRGVDVSYDGVQVLFGVDFDVEEGETVALLGTNGAGKSTLLRAISGIQEASNGAILLDGIDITHAPPHFNAERGIVMIPGGRAIFPTLTVEENLRAAAWMYKSDPDFVKQRVEEILGYFPILRERYKQLAGNLSGGEQQMLSLGQAFLMKPRLLMIDELSLGLAPAVIELLLDIIKKISAQGTTILLVEQSVNLALAIADRSVFMEKGEVRFDGPTSELLANPDIVRSVFLGQSRGMRGMGGVSSYRAGIHDEAKERLLVVDDVHVRFGGVRALNGASIQVDEGEIVGIIGQNGAGKTTLTDVIAGAVRAPQLTAGTVKVLGQDVTKMGIDARARLGVSRSYQNVRLFPQLTVSENIAVALEKRLRTRSAVFAALWLPHVRRDEKRVLRRVENLIEGLGLADYRDKFVGELSTGSRRIVDIACQLAASPKLLILDEPSSGLAQSESEELAPLMQRIRKEIGCSILVIEHDIPLIISVSDRLIAMELGTVVLEGLPTDVVNDARIVQSYLGNTEEVIARSGERRTGAAKP